jgi:hypothetical protein
MILLLDPRLPKEEHKPALVEATKRKDQMLLMGWHLRPKKGPKNRVI